MFDLKVKYDESDHVVIRATRAFTDKMTDLFGEFCRMSAQVVINGQHSTLISAYRDKTTNNFQYIYHIA